MKNLENGVIDSEENDIIVKQLVDNVKTLSFGQVDSLLVKLIEDPCLEEIRPYFETLNVSDLNEMIKLIRDLHKGEAFRVYVRTFDGNRLTLIARPSSTIMDLKNCFRYVISAREELKLATRFNWKKIWKRLCLSFRGVSLLDNSKRIDEYGIGPDEEISLGLMRFRRGELIGTSTF